MKRHGYLFDKFVSMENLDLAERKARRGKGARHEVRRFLPHRKQRLSELKTMLESGGYTTSEHRWKKVYDPKERTIGVLPYYPDLIVQYALLNILEPIFMRQMISDTYSCIKGRGIHACAKKVISHLRKHPEDTVYALQIDVSKFYPNINHTVLEDKLRRIIKDRRILAILFNIIESEPGLVIGDHIASWMANIYLSGFDHRVKEVMRVRHYFRYADDILVLAGDKGYLWEVLSFMERELKAVGLQIKHNMKVFPVDAQGIDFIGYRFFHTHTLLRKRIKKHLMRKVKTIGKEKPAFDVARQELAGHWGWLKHCNSKNLQKNINKKLGYNEDLFKRKAVCLASAR